MEFEIYEVEKEIFFIRTNDKFLYDNYIDIEEDGIKLMTEALASALVRSKVIPDSGHILSVVRLPVELQIFNSRIKKEDLESYLEFLVVDNLQDKIGRGNIIEFTKNLLVRVKNGNITPIVTDIIDMIYAYGDKCQAEYEREQANYTIEEILASAIIDAENSPIVFYQFKNFDDVISFVKNCPDLIEIIEGLYRKEKDLILKVNYIDIDNKFWIDGRIGEYAKKTNYKSDKKMELITTEIDKLLSI